MESQKHQELLNELARRLEETGVTITHLDISGTPEFFDEKYRELPTPGKREGHVPDLEGVKDKLTHLGESKIDVNNDSNIDSQLGVFAHRTMGGKNIPLHIMIPKNLEEDLIAKLKDLGLYNKYADGQIFIWT